MRELLSNSGLYSKVIVIVIITVIVIVIIIIITIIITYIFLSFSGVCRACAEAATEKWGLKKKRKKLFQDILQYLSLKIFWLVNIFDDCYPNLLIYYLWISLPFKILIWSTLKNIYFMQQNVEVRYWMLLPISSFF